MSVTRARMAFAMNAPALRSAAAVVPWAPTDLGVKLKFWINPDDHGTALWTDDGAGLISLAKDRVGNMSLTALTTARPTWAATVFNGVSGITTNGSTNILAGTTLPTLPTGATAGEMWCSVKSLTAGATAGGKFYFCYGDNNVNKGRYLYRLGVTNVNRAGMSDTTVLNTDTVLDFSNFAIVGGAWAGTTESLRLNGQAATPASTVIPTLSTGTVRLAIGGAANGTPSGNVIFRHGLVTTTLTLAEQQKLEGWLAWDAGIAAVLPVGHPYKSAAP